MKNKIGILENDIYLFPIVNSVILLSAQFLHAVEGSTALGDTAGVHFANRGHIGREDPLYILG